MSLSDYIPRIKGTVVPLSALVAAAIAAEGCATYKVGSDDMLDKRELRTAVAEQYQGKEHAVKSETKKAEDPKEQQASRPMITLDQAVEQINTDSARLNEKEAGIRQTMTELKDYMPQTGKPVFVWPASYATEAKDGGKKVNFIAAGTNFTNTTETGIGSKQELVYDITQYFRQTLGAGKDVHIAAVTFSKPEVTGGFNDLLLLYTGNTQVNPHIFSRNVKWLNAIGREKDIPSLTILLDNKPADFEYEIENLRGVLDKLTGAGMAAWNTSELYGQPEVGLAGYVAKELTKGVLNLFRDKNKTGDVDYTPNLYLGMDGASLTPEQKLWKAYNLEHVASVNYLMPLRMADGNNALIILRSDRPEIMEDPRIINATSYLGKKGEAISMGMPPYLGKNFFVDKAIDYAAGKAQNKAEAALYRPPVVTQTVYVFIPGTYLTVPGLPPISGGVPIGGGENIGNGTGTGQGTGGEGTPVGGGENTGNGTGTGM